MGCCWSSENKRRVEETESLLASKQFARYVTENDEDLKLLDASKIKIKRRVGKGAFATVYEGTYEGNKVAVKKYYYQTLNNPAVKRFCRESRLIRTLDHPNVLHFYGFSVMPPHLCLVTEFYEKGCLRELLKSGVDVFPFEQIIRLALGCARGMEHLHTRNPPIIWRDCKSANYLVGADDQVVLADLGESREVRDKMTRGVGTPLWMAPEVMQGQSRRVPYTTAADVYGLALVFWEIATRRTPFDDVAEFSVQGTAGRNIRPPMPESLNADFAKLISDMWATEPEQRPTATQVVFRLETLKLKLGMLD